MSVSFRGKLREWEEMKLVERILWWKDVRGMTRRELTRAAKISEDTIGTLMRGENQNMNLRTLLSLCDVLAIDLSDVLPRRPYLPQLR